MENDNSSLFYQRLFEQEFGPLSDAVFAYAFRLTQNKTRAEDLVQETFMRAWRFIERYQPGTNAKAWLFRICKNLFINTTRQASTRFETENYEDHANHFEKSNPFIDELDREAMSEEVMDAVNRLPARARHIVLLDLEDFSYQEIADLMDMPIGTVRSTLHRARARLGKELGEYARNLGYDINGSLNAEKADIVLTDKDEH